MSTDAHAADPAHAFANAAAAVRDAVVALLDELFLGPRERSSWILDSDPRSGLLSTLAELSAEQACRSPAPGRPTVAQHAEHLRYSLHLADRSLQGENPYATADWKAAWSTGPLDAAAWTRLRADLREAYAALRHALVADAGWFADPHVRMEVLAHLAHTAYHVGAIRQIVPLLA